MEVPFRLARREAPTPADAYLLLAEDTRALADACVRLSGDLLPTVFPIHGGFVLVLRSAEARHLPGTIRLRRIGGDLFVPDDADLLPALLPDEVVALTQTRGLVVLPGGAVLAFDVAHPLPVSGWLAPTRVRREAWQPFPPRPERPDALTVIERPAPPAGLEMLLAGAPDDTAPLADGSTGGDVPEDARPSAGSSVLGRVSAGAKLAAGRFLAWLGRQLGRPGLARFGGDLARRAVEAVPRLSEQLFGQQEAALREVLRRLQSGDVEGGLRRAPIAVPDPDQPARIGTDARLASRDPRYSLRDLVASGGPGTAWLGGGDVWAELAREYRRLAEESAARGDFRRAAYLHGVLLRDLRGAANVLMKGGLYRDAGILLRDRLNDPLAAAQAFEQAGDHDEALRLYDKHGHYEKAAELLRVLGEEDRAVAYFVRAADQFAGRGFLLNAGDLLRTKAHRPDLAVEYYRRGWTGTSAESVACGERLLDGYLVAEDWPGVRALLAEAEIAFAERPGDAGRFFNYALGVGENFLPAETRDDLADRVRLLFAAHLRAAENSIVGTRLAGELFGTGRVWPGPVVRDATFAVGRPGEVPRPRSRVPVGPQPAPPVRLAPGVVTAVAVARGTFDVVVATTEAVVCWRTGEGRIVPVCASWPDRVVVVSVDPRGETVYVLHTTGAGYHLGCFVLERSGSFTPRGQVTGPAEGATNGEYHLQPAASFQAGEHRVILTGPEKRSAFVGHYLQPSSPQPFPTNGAITRLLVAQDTGAGWDWSDGRVRCWSGAGRDARPLIAEWHAPWPPAESRPGAGIDWIAPGAGVLEVAGIDMDGRLRWAEFDVHEPDEPRSRYASSSSPDVYAAACLTGPGAIAGVTARNEIHWLRVAGSGFALTAATPLGVPTAVVALFANRGQSEVVAILADGFAIRVAGS